MESVLSSESPGSWSTELSLASVLWHPTAMPTGPYKSWAMRFDHRRHAISTGHPRYSVLCYAKAAVRLPRHDAID